MAADAPPPRGPHPLRAQVMAAAGQWLGAVAAFDAWRAGAMAWHPSLAAQGERLAAEIDAAGAASVRAALAAEALTRLQAFLDGVAAYRAHPYRRDLPEPPVLARAGSARLLDYGGEGPAVLFVPSLINPAWVLDLSARRSLLRYLAGQGLRPLLLDWGRPDAREQRFDIAAYVRQRLLPLLRQAVQAHGRPVTLAGFCMGGNLALAAAVLAPGLVARMAFLATPWDFHAAGAQQPALVADFARRAAPLLAAEGVLPVDWQQLLFAALDPTLIEGKYRRFASLPPDSPEAADFVALEDWAGSGPPLAAPVARQVFADWYGANLPARRGWRLDDAIIDPAAMKAPSLLAIPRRDRIVPPQSAMALAATLPNRQVLQVDAGHVGMVVGARAESLLWRPLAAWLAGDASGG
ncbi:MAG: alpha/beta fold hydrolase [Sphingomonadales bacterium]